MVLHLSLAFFHDSCRHIYSDETIRLWDGKISHHITTPCILKDHSETVYSVTFTRLTSPRDLATKRFGCGMAVLSLLSVASRSVNSVALSPDGSILAASGVQLWDVGRSSHPSIPTWTLAFVRFVTFSSDGSRTALAAGNSCGIYDHTQRPWLETHVGIRRYDNRSTGILASPKGSKLAYASDDGTAVQVVG